MGNLRMNVMAIDSREKSAYRLFDENLAARGPAGLVATNFLIKIKKEWRCATLFF